MTGFLPTARMVLAALPLLLAMLLVVAHPAWAGPVSWKEVPPTAEGRQWWDEGSLRRNRAGNLTVLSRYQAAPELDAGTTEAAAAATFGPAAPETGAERRGDASPTVAPTVPAGSMPPAVDQRGPTPLGSLPAAVDQRPSAAGRFAPPISRLYVMELDCDQSLYRDISINGLPQFGASWQPTGSDDLTAEVLRQACAAEAA